LPGAVWDGLILAYVWTAAAGVLSFVVLKVLQNILDMSLAVPMSTRLARDNRAPIMFLRSFTDDRISLPRERPVLSFRRTPKTADELIESVFGGFGPFVAIGKPGDQRKYFGASREFVPEDRWKARVVELIGRSQLIVAFVDLTEGISWEVSEVMRQAAEHKTLFVIPPGIDREMLRVKYSGEPLLRSLFEGPNNIAMFFYKGETIAFAARRSDAATMQAMCNYVSKYALKDRWFDDGPLVS
jgi:hypothetical protein